MLYQDNLMKPILGQQSPISASPAYFTNTEQKKPVTKSILKKTNRTPAKNTMWTNISDLELPIDQKARQVNEMFAKVLQGGEDECSTLKKSSSNQNFDRVD